MLLLLLTTATVRPFIAISMLLTTAAAPSPLPPCCLSSTEQVLRPGEVWEFPSIELASKYCEDEILTLATERALVDSTQSAVALEDVLRMHVDSVSGRTGEGGQ